MGPEIKKFRDMSPPGRINELALSDEDAKSLTNGGLNINVANKLIENVIGIYSLPIGIAPDFLINGKIFNIPMVTEEPSIIAGVSKAAKIFKESGGIVAGADEPIGTGQIQLIAPKKKLEEVAKIILANKNGVLDKTNSLVPNLIKHGGGVKNIETKIIANETSPMVILNIFVDTGNAMGANIINSLCEEIAPYISELTDTEIGIKIISNFSDKRLSWANVSIPHKILDRKIAEKIVSAQIFAENDIYRAATNNKGIFNGIDALAIATGNDWRALEAAGHAYAARNGEYMPLTTWKINDECLNGHIALSIQVGVVGGIINIHPVAKTSLKILGIKTSGELGQVMASLGLAQNFAALHALTTEGIQKGHMKLHKRKL